MMKKVLTFLKRNKNLLLIFAGLVVLLIIGIISVNKRNSGIESTYSIKEGEKINTFIDEEYGFSFDYFSSHWYMDVSNPTGENNKQKVVDMDNYWGEGQAEVNIIIKKNVSLDKILEEEEDTNCGKLFRLGKKNKKICDYCSVEKSSFELEKSGIEGKKFSKISEKKCKANADCNTSCVDKGIRSAVFKREKDIYIIKSRGGDRAVRNFNKVINSFHF